MKRYLVIDGYNLLHAAAEEENVTLTKELLEEQRDNLIERIANYVALTGRYTVLVFDAWARDDSLSESNHKGITLVYTGKDQTADSYIESYLYSCPRLAQVRLVTSDLTVQNMALLTNAERVSSRQFLKLMKEAETVGTAKHAAAGKNSGHKVGDHLSEDQAEKLNRLRLGKE